MVPPSLPYDSPAAEGLRLSFRAPGGARAFLVLRNTSYGFVLLVQSDGQLVSEPCQQEREGHTEQKKRQRCQENKREKLCVHIAAGAGAVAGAAVDFLLVSAAAVAIAHSLGLQRLKLPTKASDDYSDGGPLACAI